MSRKDFIAGYRAGKRAKRSTRKRSDFWNPSDSARQLMDIDNEVWDFFGWNSGNQVREHWDDYVQAIGRKTESAGIYWVDDSTVEDLTDNNYHSLVKALWSLDLCD